MPQLRLENDGQTAVGAQSFQVKKRHATKLFPRINHLVERCAGALDKAMKSGINGRHQQFIFVFEVQINSAVRHPGAVSNLSYAGVEKTMLGNDFNGGIKDTLVLVGGTVHRSCSRL
jgi:hypothetical protein